MTPTLPATLPTALLARLAAMYAEPHRRYHTQAHVDALRSSLQRYRHLAIQPAVIDAAIWFHDAVYETHRDDNEARSADMAQRELTAIGWPTVDVVAVVGIVEATAHHTAPAEARDTRLMLDLDLSVLGQTPARYAAYSAAVRAEYDWVDSARYRAGRTKVLQGFMRRERIFHTPALHAAWETAARHNLQHELDALHNDDTHNRS